MISRKSALRIHSFYEELITVEPGFAEPYLATEWLWNLLYEQDFVEWFLDLIKKSTDPVKLKQVILELHTGRIIPRAIAVTPQGCQMYGQAVLTSLAKFALVLTGKVGHERVTLGDLGQSLKRQLELDGYVFKDGELYLSETSVIDEDQEQSYLEHLIDTLHLSDPETIKHHLKLSEEHYLNKKWDDSISNSRKVLDAILSQLAMNVYLTVKKKPIPPQMLKNAMDIRLFLERQGLITTQERELIEKLYGLLSSTGGHPYIAEQDQARLMRQQVLTSSQFVLLQYQGFKTANP